MFVTHMQYAIAFFTGFLKIKEMYLGMFITGLLQCKI